MKTIPTVVGAFIVYNALSFATLLIEVPLVRLFERSICDRFYRDRDGRIQHPDEAQCKIKVVQDLLATVMGWQMSFASVPGLLLGAYFGRAADRHGKRVILMLCTIGILAMWLWILIICGFDAIFKVQLAWISAVFVFLGGGPRVFNGMVYALVSDSVVSSDRVRYLFLLHAGPHINRLITPRIAATLMQRSIYLPFIVSISLLSASLLIVLATNEQCDTRSKGASETQYHALPHDEPPTTVDAPQQQCEHLVTTVSTNHSIPFLHHSYWKTPYHDTILLFSPTIPLFCLAAFFTKRVAFTSEGFIFQYTSEKFGWPLERTTWLRVSAASGAILTTLVICPLMAVLCQRHTLIDPHRLELWVIRVCLVVLVASFASAFEAVVPTNLVVSMLGMGLGEGLEPALQGLITRVTCPSRYSQLFTVLAQVDTLAELVGGPVTAALMGIGRGDDGEPSEGWCFLASAVMFASLTIWSFLVPHVGRAVEH